MHGYSLCPFQPDPDAKVPQLTQLIWFEYLHHYQYITKPLTDSSIREDFEWSKDQPDKNLINTVENLDETPVNSLKAQQKQARNDRRK
ncbi:hypothetical protein PaelaDRAFT_5519 [Paenibacillus lactis 154]|uniref:Uncharacterized protein n=1 Tax=Paenibacillus lactis 154 TaxID=743719 RepID=G4HNF8_9BACL|nr:hypothetical protein PaelaDRAFT_5519 [Paenibacillus lactis 154]